MHLYVIEPSGKYSRLKSYAVQRNTTYTMKAVAEDPTGKHAFVAVYTKDEKPTKALGDNGSEKSLALLDVAPKGVRLTEDKPVPMAVYRFPDFRVVRPHGAGAARPGAGAPTRAGTWGLPADV